MDVARSHLSSKGGTGRVAVEILLPWPTSSADNMRDERRNLLWFVKISNLISTRPPCVSVYYLVSAVAMSMTLAPINRSSWCTRKNRGWRSACRLLSGFPRSGVLLKMEVVGADGELPRESYDFKDSLMQYSARLEFAGFQGNSSQFLGTRILNNVTTTMIPA